MLGALAPLTAQYFNVSFEQEAIMQGEWWRLWTAHFTHFKHSQLFINSAVMGIIARRFAKT